VESARAQRAASNNQLAITKRKGLADIEAARARVTQARAQLDVASANRSQTPAFQQNLAALRASVTAAQAQLRQARTRAGDTVLKSPIEGSVTARGMDPGALASPGTPILTVQFLDWLYVTSSLPLEQSASVYKGQAAQITLDALPGRMFGGRVTQVNAAADPESRQFGVSVRVENAGRLIKPGMYGRMRLVTRTFTAPVVVPREAVKESPEGTTVTVVDKEGTAEVRKVAVGVSDPTGTQILSGVRSGEQVIILSFQPVADGQKVRTGNEREGGGGGAGRPGGGGRQRGEGAGQGSRP
jgi:RND family efflux transporter MFP subunit